MGAGIFKEINPAFALRCRQAAIELYAMGEAKPGFQQGNSYGAPYRYNEDSWHDDMEWGGAELYRLTGEEEYLQKAMKHARVAETEGWMMMENRI